MIEFNDCINYWFDQLDGRLSADYESHIDCENATFSDDRDVIGNSHASQELNLTKSRCSPQQTPLSRRRLSTSSPACCVPQLSPSADDVPREEFPVVTGKKSVTPTRDGVGDSELSFNSNSPTGRRLQSGLRPMTDDVFPRKMSSTRRCVCIAQQADRICPSDNESKHWTCTPHTDDSNDTFSPSSASSSPLPPPPPRPSPRPPPPAKTFGNPLLEILRKFDTIRRHSRATIEDNMNRFEAKALGRIDMKRRQLASHRLELINPLRSATPKTGDCTGSKRYVTIEQTSSGGQDGDELTRAPQSAAVKVIADRASSNCIHPLKADGSLDEATFSRGSKTSSIERTNRSRRQTCGKSCRSNQGKDVRVSYHSKEPFHVASLVGALPRKAKPKTELLLSKMIERFGEIRQESFIAQQKNLRALEDKMNALRLRSRLKDSV